MGYARSMSGVLWTAGLAVAIGALIALPWEAAVDSELVRDTTHDYDGVAAPVDNAAYVRTTEGIYSHGTRLDAWVFIPKGLSK
ncbi:hypothetical protein MNEG_7273 [Monoraphidium neglectum]|jgi:hypothetical protein|uniref:Uncharacterized protein n=1 Tax=Monoraphidium neglectum TaxID=145388 RepID=A0A0D2MBV5_9CHLO|nr:hypothetical protein MNEG_7273 [Monoraphidium neglectum]KIZ00685.1 hypothetical protein MNEG_7273 [Monoraphidium neglectum]|eukprot:XP_013899704.1 hypothetical protein MNEG_7273 [Monoraphidium neglectum]